MTLNQWQSRFENWMAQYWQHGDQAHDVAHLRRVWQTAQQIMQGSTANPMVILAACYFHDVVNLPKDHAERHLASRQAAAATQKILFESFPDFPVELHGEVAHAVEAHSFSAGIPPRTLEAKIVQDADRLDSLGAIGLARVFYTSGALGRALFDSNDPLGKDRQLDDRRWTLDHFQIKMLRLPETMQTAEGKRLAQHNADFVVDFMAKLCAELQGDLINKDASVQRDFASDKTVY